MWLLHLNIRHWISIKSRRLEGCICHLVRVGVGEERHPPANPSVIYHADGRIEHTFSMPLTLVSLLHGP